MKDFTMADIKKLIADFYQYRLTGDKFIDNRYEQHKELFGHYEPYYRLFWYLARYLQPVLTVELGGWQGTAAAHFASGNPGGTVISIDHHSDPGDDKNKHLMELAAEQYTNFVYLQGWTWDIRRQTENFKAPIDILFIDSWHQYEYAIRDWNDYCPLLASSALVICDDITKDNGPVIAGMQKFWDELPGEKHLDESLRVNIPMGFFKVTDETI